MTRTVFFSFKPSRQLTMAMIEDFLKGAEFKDFKIRLPKEQTFSGTAPSLRRGFVFLRFRDRSDAIRLVDTMNGQKFFGGTLRISMKENGDNAYDSDERLSGSDAHEYSYDSD